MKTRRCFVAEEGRNSVLPAELHFVVGEAFADSGEVLVDCCEMNFQRLVKILIHAVEQFGFSASSGAMRRRIEAMPAARFAGFTGLPVGLLKTARLLAQDPKACK